MPRDLPDPAPGLLLNARFLTRTPTGVDRVAAELGAALIALERPGRFAGLSVFRPAGAVADPGARPAALLDLARPSRSRLRGTAWEQLSLARARRGDWLLSLCNTGPLLRSRQVVMIHDAQVFTEPGSYRPAFRHWYRAILPRLARRAAMVLTVSEHSRARLEEHGVAPRDRIRVVPNGADHILRVAPDPETLARHGLRRRGYILAIGSLAPHKNLRLLAAVARARPGHPVPVVLAGGADPGVFAAHGIAASDRLRLLGRVGEGELRGLYENALALALPSRAEGFGLPAVEAMACGCPVIAARAGALPETCGEAALLLPPAEPAAWIDAFVRIEDDPALRHRLAAAGRARVARFTWDASARILLRHLADLPE